MLDSCVCYVVVQMRLLANQQLKACVYDSEQLDMESIRKVADTYKYAIIITRELDIENEAIASSRC